MHCGVEFGPWTCLTQAAFVSAPVNHSSFRSKHGYHTGSCLGLTPHFSSSSRSWPLTPALWTADLHRHLFIWKSIKRWTESPHKGTNKNFFPFGHFWTEKCRIKRHSENFTVIFYRKLKKNIRLQALVWLHSYTRFLKGKDVEGLNGFSWLNQCSPAILSFMLPIRVWDQSVTLTTFLNKCYSLYTAI